MSCPSLWVVDIPAQWDARDAKRWFGGRARDHQRGSRRCRVCLWRDGRRLSGCMILTITCLQKDFFLTCEENCAICWIVGVEVLPHLRWGMLCVLLGVYHTLMWNRILQHGGRGLLHILLWCLLRGRWCWRRGKTTRVFQPFEISDLGAMMSVMVNSPQRAQGKMVLTLLLFLPWRLLLLPPWGFWFPWFWLPPVDWCCGG
jgi:hypothetical protein